MERSDLIINRLEECIYNGEITTEGMLKIFNLTCDYLNMRSFNELAKDKGCSPQYIHKLNPLHIKKFGIKINYSNE